jgi:hypothetical protein
MRSSGGASGLRTPRRHGLANSDGGGSSRVRHSGVGLTLLTRPAFFGDHPSGAVEIVAAIVGLLGAVTLVLASAYVLHPRQLAFSVNARATLDAIRARDPEILENERLYHETMIATLTRRREGNQPIVDRLHTAFSVGPLGLLAELGGLSLAAALAS